MRRVVLYIATSLDGYIASKEGGVEWLQGDGSMPDALGSYTDFYETIDTVILGKSTYQQIVTELSPSDWVYKDKQSIVLTHEKMTSKENIEFTQEPIADLIRRLKEDVGGDIWICGGAAIANQLIALDLIDVYSISVIPIILGEGIRLFDTHKQNTRLKLMETRTYNGIVDLVYEKR